MELTSTEIGARFEERAEAWFLAHRPGSRVLARGFRTRGGEIDRVFEEVGADGRRELVFVEVRARRGGWVDGLSSLTAPKRRRLRRTIECFIARYRGPADRVRVDALIWDGRAWERVGDLRLGD